MTQRHARENKTKIALCLKVNHFLLHKGWREGNVQWKAFLWPALCFQDKMINTNVTNVGVVY